MGRAARITPHPACPQASGHTPAPELPASAMSHVLVQPRCGPVHLWAGGCSQPPPPQPDPSDKDSCHKGGRWCPAFLLTPTLGELLCFWQDHTPAGACCHTQEPRARKDTHAPCSGSSRPTLSWRALPALRAVFFSGQVPAMAGHGAGRRILEPSWGWQELCKQRLLSREVSTSMQYRQPFPAVWL